MVYPNPSNGEVVLKTNFSYFDIRIYNLLGVEVFSQFNVNNNQKLNLKHLSSGVYTLKLNSGSKKIIKKIIISK